MISADAAKAIVLRLWEDAWPGERFAIQSCTLSPRGDYWVVGSNSEDFVLRGMFERCYVGISAHLVNALSGEVTIVGSAQSWEQILQDRYDEEAAEGRNYVLEPAFDRSDKEGLVNLHKQLPCSYAHAIGLLSSGGRQWFTGRLRILAHVREMLGDKGIQTTIVLRPDVQGAARVDEDDWRWDALASHLRP